MPCEVTVPDEKDGQFTATVKLDTAPERRIFVTAGPRNTSYAGSP